MKHVTGDDNQVGAHADDVIDRSCECTRDVCFTLVDAAHGLAIILPETQMQICQMSQFHGIKAALGIVWS